MNIIKKLFCKHKYELLLHRNFIKGYKAQTLYVFECKKCGKQTKRYSDL